ncbi:MAG: hypothetical protein LBI91_03420 [Spirochaetaceae bacterium]|nr:hypothetical protein [Spirochaetaceae bacterium]
MILAFAAFWYGIVPIIGAFLVRRTWRYFRQRFEELRLRPLLDYSSYRHGGEGEYRFIGGFESVTDGHTLWIKGAELTVPVALTGAQTYVLPMPPDSDSGGTAAGLPPGGKGASPRSPAGKAVHESFDPGKEAPQRIKWGQLTSLTEGARVFVGGALVLTNDRLAFASTKEKPLMVIFYDGPDRSLTVRTIRAGRQGNEYWNSLTPYAFALGAFSQLIMVLVYMQRPVFQLSVIAAFAAMLLPLFPLIPPGLVFTVVYRNLWWRGRVYRAYRDMVRLPLRYFSGGGLQGVLPGGEEYIGIGYRTLGEELRVKIENGEIPLLIPEKEAGKNARWYVFGVPGRAGTGSDAGKDGDAPLPAPPLDVFAPCAAVPGDPEKLARVFNRKAYVLEIVSWTLLLAGIALNAFCIAIIVFV